MTERKPSLPEKFKRKFLDKDIQELWRTFMFQGGKIAAGALIVYLINEAIKKAKKGK